MDKTSFSKKQKHARTITYEELMQLKGPIGIPLTNDYLFRAVMQEYNDVLKALICDFLHLDVKHVASVTVLNPIELGEHIDDKEFILDIKAELDDGSIINLEMQVVNYKNWPDRSLNYACREFDRLNCGDDYSETKPMHQISLLDFTLFEDAPEFYANYYLMNEKNHRKYSDKFHLAVLDLKRIDLATEEDKAYHLDTWARFFKCKEWGDVVMLAQKNENIANAAAAAYQLTQEEKIRQQCEAREDYYRLQRTQKKWIADLTQENEGLKQENINLQTAVSERDDTINQQTDKINSQADKINSQAEKINSQADKIKEQAHLIERLYSELNKK